MIRIAIVKFSPNYVWDKKDAAYLRNCDAIVIKVKDCNFTSRLAQIKRHGNKTNMDAKVIVSFVSQTPVNLYKELKQQYSQQFQFVHPIGLKFNPGSATELVDIVKEKYIDLPPISTVHAPLSPIPSPPPQPSSNYFIFMMSIIRSFLFDIQAEERQREIEQAQAGEIEQAQVQAQAGEIEQAQAQAQAGEIEQAQAQTGERQREIEQTQVQTQAQAEERQGEIEQTQVDDDEPTTIHHLRNRREVFLNAVLRFKNRHEVFLNEVIEPNTIQFTCTENLKETCAICIDNYETNNVARRLRCMHYFHKNCIDRWLQDKNICPLCKHICI
jgi:hypothetical protein